jgi:hypothetical protein
MGHDLSSFTLDRRENPMEFVRLLGSIYTEGIRTVNGLFGNGLAKPDSEGKARQRAIKYLKTLQEQGYIKGIRNGSTHATTRIMLDYTPSSEMMQDFYVHTLFPLITYTEQIKNLPRQARYFKGKLDHGKYDLEHIQLAIVSGSEHLIRELSSARTESSVVYGIHAPGERLPGGPTVYIADFTRQEPNFQTFRELGDKDAIVMVSSPELTAGLLHNLGVSVFITDKISSRNKVVQAAQSVAQKEKPTVYSY